MRRFELPIAVALMAAMMLGAQAFAADLGSLLANKEGPDQFALIHVSDLAQMMSDTSHKVWIYDANLPKTREAYGIIPGAQMLPSSDNYDVHADLPMDKGAKLIFYCANTH